MAACGSKLEECCSCCASQRKINKNIWRHYWNIIKSDFVTNSTSED